jgi:SnoaL-like domain
MDATTTLRALTSAFNQRDADGVVELLHPDVELRLISSTEPIRGHEAALQFYRDAFSRRVIWDATATPVPAGPNRYRLTGRTRYTEAGVTRDVPATWLVDFRGGLVSSIQVEVDDEGPADS